MASQKATSTKLKRNLSMIQNKISSVEENHALGQIEICAFERTKSKLLQKRKEIENQLLTCKNNFSNSSLFIETALQMCLNLKELWVFASYEGKRKLIEILFPGGVTYDRETDTFKAVEKITSLIDNEKAEFSVQGSKIPLD